MTVQSGKKAEFYSEKSKTIICDIDGTILKHLHKFSDLNKFSAELLPGILEKFDEWDSLNHKIILMTARKESGREMTEKHLKDLGLMWDQLIMGVSGGTRILINDKLEDKDPDRAIAINVKTNSGFNTISWEEAGL
jgi:hydroxymethylpyrimidine pyrophosphatase-like HAD family hydrolase